MKQVLLVQDFCKFSPKYPLKLILILEIYLNMISDYHFLRTPNGHKVSVRFCNAPWILMEFFVRTAASDCLELAATVDSNITNCPAPPSKVHL